MTDSAFWIADSTRGMTDFILENFVAENGYFDDVNDRLRVGMSAEFFNTSSTLHHASAMRGSISGTATGIYQSSIEPKGAIDITSVQMSFSDRKQLGLGAAGGFQSLPQIELLRFLTLREVPNLLSRWTAASATSKVCSRRH